MPQYVKPERVSLKASADHNEKWVQGIIAADPSVVGLGDFDLLAQERMQPRAGRLDLLLRDPETLRRYEVELQLGATDEAHIIRTIEYWDIERKRYPQYDHCAVLIAEDITSRFLNVISLFNGTVPLIAIQLQAYRVGDQFTLVFTRVMDEMPRGLVDEDEDAESAPADRPYWEDKASKASLQLVDKLLVALKEFDRSLELKFNKHYIGLAKDGLPYNFVTFKPKKSTITFEVKLPKSEEVSSMIETAGLDSLEYNEYWRQYRLRLTPADIEAKAKVLKDLMKLAYERRAS